MRGLKKDEYELREGAQERVIRGDARTPSEKKGVRGLKNDRRSKSKERKL